MPQVIKFTQLTFLTSAAKLSGCPPDLGAEIAFVGRSNVGKSSALNAIANINQLARVSKTPGRTQLINFFNFENTDDRRLVDLPGYGYAKVAVSVVAKWQAFINEYLTHRQSLKGVFILLDIRRGMLEIDQKMLDWCDEANLPVHLLLTKADKFSYSKAKSALLAMQQQLRKTQQTKFSIQLFSALKKSGIEDAQHKITEWLSDAI